MWLFFAGVCGFLSLLSCGGAGYAIYHVETNLQDLEKRIEEDELAQKDRKNAAKEEEIRKRLVESDKEQVEYKRYRWFAIAGAVLGLTPPCGALLCLIVSVVQFRKNPDEDEEEDKDEDKDKDEDDDDDADE